MEDLKERREIESCEREAWEKKKKKKKTKE